MFIVYFDDHTTVRIWCRKDDIWAEALQVCAEYNHYYHEHYLVTKIVEETDSE